MARRRREFSTFSLSFIDCMSCGLGAVILLFMIINHASERRAAEVNREVAQNLSAIEAEVLERRATVATLEMQLQQTRADTEAARERAAALAASLERRAPSAEDSQTRIALLKQKLRTLEARVKDLRAEAAEDNATRAVAGEGSRRYLTGLAIEGERILLLVDRSASMLAPSIVNIIRRRNMGVAARKSAPKWQRTLETVNWLTAQIPAASRFQVYSYADDVQAVLEGTLGQWLGTGGGQRLTAAVQALHTVVPGGGTDLRAAFIAAGRLSPAPDTIIVITDSLPTQGAGKTAGAVSGEQRISYFREALEALPGRATVNVILMPMEGDPYAASAYWSLALNTGGTFLVPSEGWP